MKTKMKNILIMLAAFAGLITSKALGQSTNTTQEALKIFSSWVGEWKGEGTMRRGPGEPQTSSVHEKIEMKLDGTLLYVEGIGKSIDPSTQQEMVTHHAIGLLHYNDITKEYKFRSHLKTGQMTDAWFNVIATNQYQWGFDTPQGKIRYTVNLDPTRKTWNEIGEFSRDGSTYMKFFEMNLSKVQ